MDATDAARAALRRHRFPGGADSTLVRPLVVPEAAPYHEALAEGRLRLPACTACARCRWPAAPACPHCGADGMRWVEASGRGTVHAVARYHKAFLPAYEAFVPYAVLNVALAEGPRIIGRWLGPGVPAIGTPVAAAVECWDDGLAVLAFEEARA